MHTFHPLIDECGRFIDTLSAVVSPGAREVRRPARSPSSRPPDAFLQTVFGEQVT